MEKIKTFSVNLGFFMTLSFLRSTTKCIVNKDPSSTKSQGGQKPQIFQKLTPQILKFTFYCIFILQFSKVKEVSWPSWPRGGPWKTLILNWKKIQGDKCQKWFEISSFKVIDIFQHQANNPNHLELLCQKRSSNIEVEKIVLSVSWIKWSGNNATFNSNG